MKTAIAGKASRNEAQEFDDRMRMEVRQFQECVAKADEEYCVALEQWVPLTAGLYYYLVKRWLDLFPREYFMFVRTEDFGGSTSSAILGGTLCFEFRIPNSNFSLEMQQFIGVDVVDLEVASSYVSSYRAGMLNSTRQFLSEFYQPYNRKLYDLLGIDYQWDMH